MRRLLWWDHPGAPSSRRCLMSAWLAQGGVALSSVCVKPQTRVVLTLLCQSTKVRGSWVFVGCCSKKGERPPESSSKLDESRTWGERSERERSEPAA